MRNESTGQAALLDVQEDPVRAMRRIMESEPALTIYGFDDNSDQILIEKGRQELLETPDALFVTSSEWFSFQKPLDSPIGGIYSHFLKHEISNYVSSILGYPEQIQEGVVIAAAIQMGFPVDGTCGGSALIGVQLPNSS